MWMISTAQTYGHLHHIFKAGPGGFQNCLGVLTHLVRLLLDRALDDGPVGLGGNLARHEDEAVGLDGLGVRPDCLILMISLALHSGVFEI